MWTHTKYALTRTVGRKRRLHGDAMFAATFALKHLLYALSIEISLVLNGVRSKVCVPHRTWLVVSDKGHSTQHQSSLTW